MIYRSFLILLCLSACLRNEKNETKEDILFLDHAASLSINEQSLNEFIRVSKLDGNSSGLNRHAKHLKKLEEQAAKTIANKIGAAAADQIHFTNGATVANNIAVLGVAYKNPKCHLITSKIEHKSVLNVFQYLEERGYKVTYLDVDHYGKINLDQLRKSITKDTKLISIQMFNSEIGTLQNVEEIGKIAKERGVLFHTDAAQSFCKYDIDVKKMNIDLLTISGHKIGSPKGIAALYAKDISQLQPIMFGSGDDLSPGTKPTALICAFSKAVQNFHFDKKQVNRNFRTLTSELSKIEKLYINSATPSHVVSVSIDAVLLSDVILRMKNYSFSSGCSCLGQDKSNVIAAIDPEDKLPSCVVRISFSDKTNESQLILFAQKLKELVERLRKEKSVGKGCQSTSSVLDAL